MAENSEQGTKNILNNIIETIADTVQHHKSEPDKNNIIETIVDTVQHQTIADTVLKKRLFGRQRSIHSILGGGQSADVLLWKNKKISSSVLTCATIIWVLLEWLNYHFLTLIVFVLFLGMLVQFAWSNASGVLGRSSSQVPRLVLPENVFVNVAVSLGDKINQFLGYIQDVACGGNLKQFLVVVASMWAAAIIGTWCNFLTVIYVGFVCAHTLPILYEKYEDQIDAFLNDLFGQMQNHYSKLDVNALNKLKGNLRSKKND